MRWPYPSEITLAETDRVAGKHREIGGQLIFALAGLARALQEDALLVGAIGEAVGLGDGAADGEALRIGIFAGLVHFAEHIDRSEEHTSELQSLMRISYAVFCLQKKK